MRRDDDRLLLFDTERAAERIISYTAQGRAEFLGNEMAQDAVIRNLEIIGEAAGKLSDAAKERVADVPWRRVVGPRNVLIHRYRDVDIETVWHVVAEDLDPAASVSDADDAARLRAFDGPDEGARSVGDR